MVQRSVDSLKGLQEMMLTLNDVHEPARAFACSIAFLCVVGGAAQPVVGAERTADRVGHTGEVMTVTGPVDPNELGVTLPHEHVIIDFTLPLDAPQRWILAERRFPATPEDRALWNTPIEMRNRAFLIRNIWNNRDSLLLQDTAQMATEVRAFKAAGGGTIVDVTSVGLGRDPRKLAEISRQSEVKIVMGSGWYRAAWHPDGHAQRSVESLTDEIVRDLDVGVDGTDIRAGIIGEVSAMDVVAGSETAEMKGIRAAGRASRLTGASITIHQWLRDGVALNTTLKILEEEKADLSRVVIGHIDAVGGRDISRLVALLKRGVTLEFDLFGTPYYLSDPRLDHRPMADTLVTLVKQGFGSQILMSQDVCTQLQTQSYGGGGYDYILTVVAPYLIKQGLSQAQVRQIMVDNPRRLLTRVAPR